MDLDLTKTEDLEKLDSMSPEEIENIRVEEMKELGIIQNHTALVEQEFLGKQLAIIKLQTEKKELEIALSKGKQVIRDKQTRLKILLSKFWYVKNG